jgi:hypothetical protein
MFWDEFGSSFETHIVSSTHDGAAVMKKYGNEISAECQFCLNHGMHLAVKDLFYKSVGRNNEYCKLNNEMEMLVSKLMKKLILKIVYMILLKLNKVI